MASILDKYGIKEVADITFYHIDDNGAPDYPVLYIDTAKTSTIEQTADEATANGGKGNVALISWDYNKDINVSLEDALFSAKSMAIMFGDGTVTKYKKEAGKQDYPVIMKTEQFTVTADCSIGGETDIFGGQCGWNKNFVGPDGYNYKKLNSKFFDEDGTPVSSFVKGSKYFCSYDLAVDGAVIRISADSFPGTYYVVGDTWARPQAGGDDEFFQFIIPKAKIKSENTITLEADGDPSVFSMNLHVLRPESGDMMMLVKYDLVDATTKAGSEALNLYHNHTLLVDNDSADYKETINGSKDKASTNSSSSTILNHQSLAQMSSSSSTVAAS